MAGHLVFDHDIRRLSGKQQNSKEFFFLLWVVGNGLKNFANRRNFQYCNTRNGSLLAVVIGLSNKHLIVGTNFAGGM